MFRLISPPESLCGTYRFAVKCLHSILPTNSDYEVPGMILLRDLKGAVRLDCSKNMFAHISPCTTYDFNALTLLCLSCGADKTCVFLHLVANMCHEFLSSELTLNCM